MTDLDLARFLGIAGDPRWPAAIAALAPEKRAAYEHLYDVDRQLKLYELGLGPKPAGVILCHQHRRRRAP
jgi:hypothetical protein